MPNEEGRKFFSFNMGKLRKIDYISVVVLLIIVILLSYPTLFPKEECEVTQPNGGCASAKDVMIENCRYWGRYSCDSQRDVSLPQVEWYIGNLCKIASRHQSLDCSNLKGACNQIVGEQVC